MPTGLVGENINKPAGHLTLGDEAGLESFLKSFGLKLMRDGCRDSVKKKRI